MGDLRITSALCIVMIFALQLLVGCGIPVPIPTYSAPPDVKELKADSPSDIYVLGWGEYQNNQNHYVSLVATAISESNTSIQLADAEQFWLATKLPNDGAPLKDVFAAEPYVVSAGLNLDYIILINQHDIKVDVDKEAAFTHATTLGFSFDATIIDWKKQLTVMHLLSSDERLDWEVGGPFVFYNALRTDPMSNACKKLGESISSVIRKERGDTLVRVIVLDSDFRLAILDSK
ncbi:MAG: hypothetical protein AB8I58_24010 [Anaerolineales bacterium]|jgi:hypothetical protein